MYAAIINIPGYLPDTEPEEFETCQEAWQYLVSELEWSWEVEETQRENFDHDYLQAHTDMHSLDQNLPGTVYAGNYAYSVEYTGEN